MKRPASSQLRGLTLVELLLVLVITAILAAAIGSAFSAELTLQRIQESRRAQTDRSEALEREITRLLQGAKLSVGAALPAGPPTGTGVPTGTAATPGAGDTTTYFWGLAENGANDLGCDRLTFTTTAPAIPMAALGSTDDFETQQRARGPVGGPAEVSLSKTPVGDAGRRTGLFERIQRPSDSDPSQGGSETDLDFQVDRIGFQFWDGLEWVPRWNMAIPPRLPAAVRVSYTLEGATSTEVHVFVVPIPASDVDTDHPASDERTQ